MEEEIIEIEEVPNYDKLRYILDKNGYIFHASFGGLISCDLGECTEYVGEVPSGYETIEEWYDGEIDKLNAWKIVEDNLVFDDKKYNELEEQRKRDEIDNSCVTHKELYGLQKEIEDIQDVNNSQYTEASANGKVITIDNVKKVYPKVKLTNIDCYSFNKIDLIASGKNILPNEAVTQEISGVTFTQNEDRSITIDGTSTEDIEYNIFGTNNNVSPILVLKKDANYYLSSNGHQIKMYNYDGTNRTEIYSGTGGIINFTDEDKLVTHIVLYIPNETTVKDVTVYPQLEVGSTGTDYIEYQSNMITVDFSEYVEEGLFPSDELFPSDDLFPKGTTISYILIENGKAYIKVNEKEEEIEVNQVHLFDGYNTIYTIQDTNIEIDYCINNLKLEGTVTKNNNFKVLEDGSIEAHNGYFSGKIAADSGDIGGFTLLPEEFNSTSSITRNYTENDKTRLQQILLGNISSTDEDYENYDLNGDKCLSSLDYVRMEKIINGDLSPIQTSYFSINSNDPVHCLSIKNSETDSNGVSLGLYGGYISELGVKQLSSKNDNYKLLVNSYQVSLTDDENSNITNVTADGITTPIVTQTSLAEQKKNFEKFENALPILNDIDIYKYNLKFEEDNHKKHIGFVIGEDYKYSSEITAVNKDGKEIGVDNYSMTSLCLQAIKELSNKVETLEKRIKEMEER